MQYKGELYGKVGRKYIPMKLSAEDVDKLRDYLIMARFIVGNEANNTEAIERWHGWVNELLNKIDNQT